MSEYKKCLMQWHDYSEMLQSAMQNFRLDEELLDCTLACDGYTVRAHKLVLAASSQYFRQVFKDFPCKHPTIIIEGIRMRELMNILHFMYSGKLLIDEDDIVPLLLAAATLAVDGLSCVTAAVSKCPTESQASSGYEGSPLDLNEEHSQDRPANEIDDEETTNCSDFAIDQGRKSVHPVAPPLKRIRTAPERLSLEEDVPKKRPVIRFTNEFENENVEISFTDEVENLCIRKDIRDRNETEEKSNPIDATSTPVLNGHSSQNEKSDLNNDDRCSSPENGDFDCGPPPLPPNRPAVLAALAAASGGTTAGLNYAYLSAGGGSQRFPSPYGSVNSPSLLSWPKNETSIPSSAFKHQEYIHPIGHSVQELQDTLEQYQRKLAFHEPRPCPTCKRMYRDAATLRTHIAIMHYEGKEPFSCTCGFLFRTKYDMYQHKKNGHR